MKNRLTFLLITSRSGAQRRFSINKKLFYFLSFFLLVLIGSGAIGVWKAAENLELTQKKHLLETEQQQMRTIAKYVNMIEQDEITLRCLLGLEDKTPNFPSDPKKN